MGLRTAWHATDGIVDGRVDTGFGGDLAGPPETGHNSRRNRFDCDGYPVDVHRFMIAECAGGLKVFGTDRVAALAQAHGQDLAFVAGAVVAADHLIERVTDLGFDDGIEQTGRVAEIFGQINHAFGSGISTMMALQLFSGHKAHFGHRQRAVARLLPQLFELLGGGFVTGNPSQQRLQTGGIVTRERLEAPGQMGPAASISGLLLAGVELLPDETGVPGVGKLTLWTGVSALRSCRVL
jgi:hypothetical protein